MKKRAVYKLLLRSVFTVLCCITLSRHALAQAPATAMGRLLTMESNGTTSDIYLHDFDSSTTTMLINDALGGVVSPDMRSLAYSRRVSSTEMELRIIGVDGTNDRHVVNVTGNALGNLELIGWTPSGLRLIFKREIITCNQELYSVLLDGTDEQLFMDPVIADGNDRSIYGACFDPSHTTITWASQDGCWSPTTQIYQAAMIGDQIDVSSVVQLTDNSVYEDLNRSSAVVGGKIAFWRAVGHPYSGAYHEIFVMNNDGTGEAQITSNGYADNNAVISPDGKHMMWATYANGSADIMGYTFAGGTTFPYLATGDNEVPLAWLPSAGWSSVDDGGINATPMLIAQPRAYPNPFNPSTSIAFVVPADGHVSLLIYDLSGRLVRTLVDSRLTSGMKSERWDGMDNRGLPAASGTYFVSLHTPQGVSVSKAMLLK